MLYTFGDHYTLDPAGYELRQHGRLIRLEPRVFDCLAYLVQSPDRTVTKEELVAHLWPQPFVTDDALTYCVAQARKALGDTGQTQRYIQTVRRRGYRFIAPVAARPAAPLGGDATALAPGEADPAGTPREPVAPRGDTAAPAPPPLLAGRERELDALHRGLATALTGVRQLLFVTGEAGLGKTTLIDTFLTAVEGQGPLGIGRGQCLEHYGAGEAYLPILEAVERLCRGPDGQEVVALLAQQAPTWLVQMPGLLRPADQERLQQRLGQATRERMLRELAEAFNVLTAARPLVLVLEDLHWSDYATLDVLAALARRREPARLLLLGTYRPPDALQRGHPLSTVHHELQRHGQCVDLPLSLLPEVAVAAYLAQRFPDAHLPAGLARLLQQRTEGNPFFMVTVVDDWLRRGWLVPDDGGWTLRVGLAAFAVTVPETLRQMLEQHLDRLSPLEQRVLEAGSVAGTTFAAAAAAACLAHEVVQVEDGCASLARRRQWLEACGAQVWPDGTVTEDYRFTHALYQEVAYTRLTAARRVQLHRRMGEREETGYGPQVRERAAILAMHFERGRDFQRAVRYRRYAGENALQRSAYVEAIAHLTQGLAWLSALPETPERAQQELDLQIALGAVLQMAKGLAAPEVEHAYTQAHALCQQVGETPELVQVLFGLWRYAYARSQLHTAREHGDTLLRLAHRAHDPALARAAHTAIGLTWLGLGAFPAARMHVEEAIAIDTPDQAHAPLVRMGLDSGVACRAYAAWILWFLGYPDQALVHTHEALALAHALVHPYSLAWARLLAAMVFQFRRDVPAVHEHAEAAVALATEQGFPLWAADGIIMRGWTLAMQGQGEEGLAQVRQGITSFRATGAALAVPYLYTLLAEVSAHLGHPTDGLQALAEAHALVEQHEERCWEAEIHRLRGVVLLRQMETPQAEAETCFQQALDVARRQQAKSLELRAAMSLARLWQRQGQRTAAYELLAPVYGWFTEGFDTADLQEAKALLDALA